jgi:hypothetical protein
MKTNDVLKGLGVVGAALAAWYLLEPKKGTQRRRRIATMGRDVYEGAGQELGRLGSEIGRLGEDVGRGFSSIVDRVGEMTGMSSGRSSSRSGSRRSSSRSGGQGGGQRRSGNGGRRRTSHATANGEASTQSA